MCYQFVLFGQITVEITGPTTANVNETKNYDLVWRNGSTQIDPPSPMESDYSWFTLGGNFNDMTPTGSSVEWTTGGNWTLNFEYYTWNDFYYDDLMVTVSAGSAPDTPNTTFTTTQNCNSTTVQRNSNPPSGVKWYWQTSSSGTSTSDSSSSINRTTSGDLYLRARQSTSPFTWSTSSQQAGNITVITTPPDVPATSTSSDIISNTGGQVTVSVSSVSGATSYRWYTVASGGTAIVGVSGTGYSPTVTQTTTYYVESQIGNCASTTRRAVTANVHPVPQISSTNNGVITMGTPVVLSLNYGYDGYQWKLNGQSLVGGTNPTYEANQSGEYSVEVSKGTATGVVSAVKLIGSGPSGQNINYIVSNMILKPGVTAEAEIETLAVEALSQAIQYFDGLGRPIQSVVTQGSPNKRDIVQPIAYDALGREAKKYLPYVPNVGDGWYKENPLGTISYSGSPQHAFYNGGSPLIAQDPSPYAETIFESSPLNRVIKQGAPGTTWQPDGNHSYASSDHTIKMGYEFNAANEVLLWTFTYPTEEYSPTATNAFGKVNAGTAASPVYYAANQLFKNLTKDEHGNQVIEYVDKQGRTILKRVQVTSGNPSTTSSAKDENYASTYYIYDDFNNLVCVIPPQATKLITQVSPVSEYFDKGETQKNDFLKLWAFRYRYDGRNRMIMKQVPGAEPVYMIYDNRDRLVLTQDGNQRSTNQWLFTKYDALNRPVSTGIYTNTGNRSAVQIAANNYYNQTPSSSWAWFETFTTTSGHVHGYDNKSFPVVSTLNNYYTITYYDNYTFKSIVSGLNYVTNNLSLTTPTGSYTQPSIENLQVKGLVTGTKVRLLESTTFLYSATYYDPKYRVIQTISQNHKSGTDRVSNLYDFTGKLLQTRRTYVVSGVTRYVQETFDYDHADRLITVKHSTNGATPIMTVKNEYNELGELVDKKLHSTDNGVTFKQSVDYRYNIRGWLTKINEPDVSTLASGETLEDYFGMELAYNNTLSGITSDAAFNGNISAVKWSTGAVGGANLQGYHYNYDALNRLHTSGHYKNKMVVGFTSDNANLETDFTYDLNGNIGGLKRRGADELLIDNLSYTYIGNRLDYVNDSGDATKGFINGNAGNDDYTYDNNGNLITDKNKGITAIAYNHLNLPKQVNKGATDYIVYTYDATGRKLAQQVYGATPKRTDYIGEMVFEGTTPALKIINHTEGRILPDGANWEYQYHLKDHLGNVRVTFTTKQQTPISVSTNFESEANTEFDNYFRTGFDLVDHTDAGDTYTYVQWLNGGENGRVGVAKAMAVMPGDKVSIGAYAKYKNLTASSNATPLIAALASAFGTYYGAPGELGKVYSGLNSFAGMVPGGDHDEDDESVPKAFVTILLFDKEYNLVDAAWKQITTDGLQSSETVKQPPHDYMYREVTVAEPGFAYVFVSNEHPTWVNVYFDDVTVTHTPSAIVSSSDYYAFGLQHTAGERAGSWEQKYLYNGKEMQDELNLGWMDYGARMYMPEIGRWGVLDNKAVKYSSFSPYSYAINNPIRFIDPDGNDIYDLIQEAWDNTEENGINSFIVQDGQVQQDPKAEEIRNRYKEMIADARKRGKNFAADNLQHFIDGKGGTKNVSVSTLNQFGAFRTAVLRNQSRFEKQVLDIAYGLKDGETRELNDIWDAVVDPSVFSELFYASGRSQVTSKGKIKVTRKGNEIIVEGVVENTWQDPYNWNQGMSAFIPGYGNISDDDGIYLEQHGGAKSYMLQSSWSSQLNGTIQINPNWFDDVIFTWK